ncbi:YtxH domain-containing protein [Pontibacter sp. KCTC 32443]|uniref:YtxH domain-containing protein n=1 Tax=Pontibacter TaxID=323449 RepID=UPI00164E013A|nr:MULTISPECIES: YtxH domain-containing protein [Pontibacter]MBC5775421.1 YtxH domain-containing protein [Pontibacter sp. KCTC 32443]
MKTTLECRSLGESKTNYTNANVRQIRQSEMASSVAGSTGSYSDTGSHIARSSYNDDWNRDASGYRTQSGKTSKSTSYALKGKGISGGKIAAGVIAGASVGVLAGILLAPEKGKDLRKQVANSASRLGDKVTKSFTSTKDKVTGWTNKNNNKQGSSYSNLTNQSSSEVNTMYNDPALGPTGGTNMQRCL